MANEVYRRGQRERMDENRACDCASANHQWVQDRELMILGHLSTTSIASHHGSQCVGFETNGVRTAITGAALRPVQAAEYIRQSSHVAVQFRSEKACFLARIGGWKASSPF